MSEPNPFGHVRIGLYVSGQWAITLLTAGWSDAEKQALLDGDKSAADALVDEAIARTLNKPYEVETEHAVIQMRDEQGAAA